MSTTSTMSPTWILAWWRDTRGSLRRTSQSGSRPIRLVPTGTGNSRPLSGPAITMTMAAASTAGVPSKRPPLETKAIADPDRMPLSDKRTWGAISDRPAPGSDNVH